MGCNLFETMNATINLNLSEAGLGPDDVRRLLERASSEKKSIDAVICDAVHAFVNPSPESAGGAKRRGKRSALRRVAMVATK